MKKDKGNRYGVYVAAASQKTAKRLEKAVMRVLNSAAGDDVKKKALEVMANSLATHADITGCSFQT